MRLAGGISPAALLLALAGPAAAELSGQELAGDLFAQCAAALADPGGLMAQDGPDAAAPVVAAEDGNLLTATAPIQDDAGTMLGMRTITATRLPGGTAVTCHMILHGRTVSPEIRSGMQEAALELAGELTGTDAISLGGEITATSYPAGLPKDGESMRMVALATTEFPPLAQVELSAAAMFTSITIRRYQAAP